MSLDPPKPFRFGGTNLVMVDVYEEQAGTGAGGFGYAESALLHENVPGELHEMTTRRAFRFGGDQAETMFDLFLSMQAANGTAIDITHNYRFKINSVWYTSMGEAIPTGDGRARIPLKITRG